MTPATAHENVAGQHPVATGPSQRTREQGQKRPGERVTHPQASPTEASFALPIQGIGDWAFPTPSAGFAAPIGFGHTGHGGNCKSRKRDSHKRDVGKVERPPVDDQE